MITVVGLGCEEGQITLAGAQVAEQARCAYVKTALTDTYRFFEERQICVQSLDFIYESAENFDELDQKIAQFLMEKERENGEIAYFVNGSGSDDRSVELLSRSTEIRIIPSVSRAAATAPPCVGATAISAYELTSLKGFDYDTRLPLIVTDIDNAYIASEVKLVLSNLLGDEQRVSLDGIEMPLYETDRAYRYDYKTTLYVPALTLTDKIRFNFSDLYCIMRMLLGENGCPWDKAQTHESIRKNAVEEAYELVDAIDNDDLDNLIEETGDVLLQAVFHCVIGEDCAEYNVQDALSILCRKLIDRHTHIFGSVKAANEEEALAAWDAAKAKEKKYTSLRDKMRKVAKALPAAERAYKYMSAAAKAGFEFSSVDQIADKVKEELNEYLSADDKDREAEGGDLMLACVNALRWYQVDPELALSHSLDKFARRVEYIENKCGGDLSEALRGDWSQLWREAKRETCGHRTER